jgi:hypothetical protein
MKSDSKQQQINITKTKTTKEDRIKYPPSHVEHFAITTWPPLFIALRGIHIHKPLVIM